MIITWLQRRTKPEAPPAVLRIPLACPVLRCLLSQLSFTFFPALEARGAKAGFDEFCFVEGASRTRIVTSPASKSFGAFSVLSRNRNLLDFLGTTNLSSAGGVGGRMTGSEFKISSGRRAGISRRGASWMTEPCKVAVLSERSSLRDGTSLVLGALEDDFACNLRCSSTFLRFSFLICSSLQKMLGNNDAEWVSVRPTIAWPFLASWLAPSSS